MVQKSMLLKDIQSVLIICGGYYKIAPNTDY